MKKIIYILLLILIVVLLVKWTNDGKKERYIVFVDYKSNSTETVTQKYVQKYTKIVKDAGGIVIGFSERPTAVWAKLNRKEVEQLLKNKNVTNIISEVAI